MRESNIPKPTLSVDLQPIIEAAVLSTLAKIREREQNHLPTDKLAFTEPEAARLLSMASHQLRDERRRGRIAGIRIAGGKIRYTREDLAKYLAERREVAE